MIYSFNSEFLHFTVRLSVDRSVIVSVLDLGPVKLRIQFIGMLTLEVHLPRRRKKVSTLTLKDRRLKGKLLEEMFCLFSDKHRRRF